MEGFANHQNVGNYSILAKYYDYLLSDEESLSLWLNEIEKEPFHTVLELASGSGYLAGMLKKKGYEVLASDLSEEMKEASKENYDGPYEILNMVHYDLNRQFDCILCVCDSINYLTLEDLDSFFACAYDHLNPNGRLIFDMHNLSRIQEFEEEYIEEGRLQDGNFYQWTISSDEMTNNLYARFTFYVGNSIYQEHHVETIFDPVLIQEKMEKAGFAYSIKSDFIPDEKSLVIGRKES